METHSIWVGFMSLLLLMAKIRTGTSLTCRLTGLRPVLFWYNRDYSHTAQQGNHSRLVSCIDFRVRLADKVLQLVIESIVGNVKLCRSCRYQGGHDGQELEAVE